MVVPHAVPSGANSGANASPAYLADTAVQLRRLEAIVDAGTMLELDWRGLTRLVVSIRGYKI